MALHPGPQWLPRLTRWQALIAGYYNHDFGLHNHLAMGEDKVCISETLVLT
jgi:hypothetical protein